MSSAKSWPRRLFGAIWAVVIGLYRLIIVAFVLLVVLALWFGIHGGAPKKIENNVALVIYPTGELVDSLDQDPAQRFLQQLAGDPPTQTLLRDLTDALEKGAQDSRIS